MIGLCEEWNDGVRKSWSVRINPSLGRPRQTWVLGEKGKRGGVWTVDRRDDGVQRIVRYAVGEE